MKQFLKNPTIAKVLKFVVAFGLIFWMVQKGLIDFSVFQLMATPLNISIALGLGFINLALSNWRWTLLLNIRKFDVGLRQTMPLTLIAVFFNFAIPGAIGGDVVKAFYIAKDHPDRRLEAVTSVIVDRVLGLYGMVCMAIFAISINIPMIVSKPQLFLVSVSSFGVFLAMTLALAAAFSKRLRKSLRIDWILQKVPGGSVGIKFYDAFQAYRQNPGVVFASLILGLMAQMVAVLFMVYIGILMGESELSFGTYIFAVPLGFIVSAIPISPAGIGVGQYAFLILFRLYSGTDTDVGQMSITAFQVVLFAWGLVGGILYLKKKKPKPKQLEEVSS